MAMSNFKLGHATMSLEHATKPTDQPTWGSPQWKSHTWVEPILVVSIMIGSMVLNRRKGFRISDSKRRRSFLGEQYKRLSSDEPPSDLDDDSDIEDQDLGARQAAKERQLCGTIIHTPNSSRFVNHWHSRVLQKFPFLVEMFYWILNFAFYACTKLIASLVFFDTGVWDVAQAHGIEILEVEHSGLGSSLFLLREVDVQTWFMGGHQIILTFLNRAYSLVHIPGTVAFISWYYYVAPNHAAFAVVRRTMTLTNLVAFVIFTLYPCMPPRLLPKEFGFHDTVRHDDAQSVWQSGKFANQLAAMPSLHFGYSFVIGCTFIYHSGVFRSRQRCENAKSKCLQALGVICGILYPSLVLTVIIATANHYWLDAIAAVGVVFIALLCNRVFMVLLPLEDILLWVLRLEKPTPTTGRGRQ